MKKTLKLNFAIVLCMAVSLPLFAQRSERTLRDGWQFHRGGIESSSAWENVRVPHDWAIYGPFDRSNDLQRVAVEQNGETEASWKTGRTGGLPLIGKGCYRTSIDISGTEGKSIFLVFDGAMSNARVSINGRKAVSWPYGYNSFYATIDSLVKPGENEILVELENYEKASRWYSGAGLYRNVHLVETGKVHFPLWETYITTPKIGADFAHVRIERRIEGLAEGQQALVSTSILDAEGREVASASTVYVCHGQKDVANVIVENPQLWSPDDPYLYSAVSTISVDGVVTDVETSRFGIRSIEYIPEKGFFLNGKMTKFKGVCNHHDLGPLGAAVNRSALRHQIELLKDMGANAIRTSHNMPAPELVELCDEMGMMLMVEPFDDWSFRPKSPNGYGAIFAEWWERDIENMVKHYRNSPSVVMWSIGNEVPSQWGPGGVRELTALQDKVHFLDPARPVTCGMDQIGAVLDNGFASSLDIPGFNYKPQYYEKAHEVLPQGLVLGSETASTVSSRGQYFFPVEFKGKENVVRPGNQSNGYDNENCYWSNTPDIDFFMDGFDYVLGQFVWTGFDYLGEPSPYDVDSWPSHSSVFGIIDLASLPKDRYYLYRSQWNNASPTLHVLPHWNWSGREGEVTPVFVYTSWPKAELFVNGVSQGIREKNDSSLLTRYRLMWNDVVYAPGEIRVVAYDDKGDVAGEKVVRTAGRPHHLVVEANRGELRADGEDLVYFTVRVADKDGNIVPTDDRLVSFKATGAGRFEATANGDPTCLMSFQKPEMKLFSGAATAIVRSGRTPGVMRFTVSAKGLRAVSVEIPVK